MHLISKDVDCLLVALFTFLSLLWLAAATKYVDSLLK